MKEGRKAKTNWAGATEKGAMKATLQAELMQEAARGLCSYSCTDYKSRER